MYRKNTAGQFISVQLVLTATGAVATGLSPTARRCIDGTFAAGGGTFTEDGTTGTYKYALSQADTNGNNISITVSATGAMPVCVNLVTTAADPTDAVRLGLTALPNAAANAAGGLPVSIAGALDLDEMNTDIEAIQTSTAGLTFSVANQVDVNVLDWKSASAPAMTGDPFARLGAPAGASVSADIAAVKAVLPTALVGGRIDANIGSVTAAAITAAGFAANALDAVWSTAARLLTAGTNIVLAKGTGVTGFNDITAAAVRTEMDANSTKLANLDATTSSRLAASSYTAPDNADIVLIKAKTDNLPAAPADESLIIAATNALGTSIAALPTANANADALLDRAAGVETGWTLRQAARVMLSALAGKASGLATTTATYRDMADSKDRISATVDSNGNRTAVTRDAS